MKKYKPVFLLIILLSATACKQAPPAVAEKYFSLPDYLQKEIPNLLQQYRHALKIVTINNHSDTTRVNLTRDDLNNYFHSFMEADITKPALRGTYKMESFSNSGTGYLSVIYTSTGKNTKPYQVVLNIGNDNKAKNIYITSYSDNVLYSSSQNLLYNAGKFIQIVKHQKMILLSPKKIQVKILFEN